MKPWKFAFAGGATLQPTDSKPDASVPASAFSFTGGAAQEATTSSATAATAVPGTSDAPSASVAASGKVDVAALPAALQAFYDVVAQHDGGKKKDVAALLKKRAGREAALPPSPRLRPFRPTPRPRVCTARTSTGIA